MEKKTIKNLAEDLNVSKTAIRKRLTEDFRKQYTETSGNGVILISEIGCAIISESLKTTENRISQTSENISEKLNFDICDVLQDTISVLQKQLLEKDKQLAEKDKQITQLTTSLVDITTALAASQALHAGSMQQLINKDVKENESCSEEPEQPKRRGFFRRLFGMKK